MACPSSIGSGPYSASTASFEGSASAGPRCVDYLADLRSAGNAF
jgi:hypothetical protein